jgi:GWxTD domain-containing protein
MEGMYHLTCTFGQVKISAKVGKGGIMGRFAKFCAFVILGGGIALAPLAFTKAAQQDQQGQQPAQDQTPKNAAKGKQKSEKDLYKELDSQYKNWLEQDVVYIISPEERNAFLHLQTNEEREQFIEAFWQRRNPDPDSADNAFKDEHYRRIAYANEHYAAGLPGWKSDRGRIYIVWGPPDSIDEHPTGGNYERPADEGGGETSTFPFEDWHYKYLEGIGENIDLEFVDTTMSGEYHFTTDPSEKDALMYVPGAGLTELEEQGGATKDDRFHNADGTHMEELGGQDGLNQHLTEFSRAELYATVFKPPEVKFKDLEAVVTSRLVRDQVKFSYRYDFLRITSDTVLVPITVQIPRRQLSFQEKSEVDSATLNLFARVTSLGGRVVQTFEDTLTADTPASLLEHSLAGSEIYQKAVPLSPGLYRLDIVIKDVNSGNVGVVNTRLPVPRFDDDQLSSSSLILADEINPVSMKDIGLGQFVLGDVKVRPKMDQTFAQSDHMGVYLQVYNLKANSTTHKSDASVEYRVMKNDAKPTGTAADPVLKFDLSSDKLPEHGEELTLENRITLGSLAPGKYRLEIAITDNLAKQTITPTADFTVRSTPAPTGGQALQGR